MYVRGVHIRAWIVHGLVYMDTYMMYVYDTRVYVTYIDIHI